MKFALDSENLERHHESCESNGSLIFRVF